MGTSLDEALGSSPRASCEAGVAEAHGRAISYHANLGAAAQPNPPLYPISTPISTGSSPEGGGVGTPPPAGTNGVVGANGSHGATPPEPVPMTPPPRPYASPHTPYTPVGGSAAAVPAAVPQPRQGLTPIYAPPQKAVEVSCAGPTLMLPRSHRAAMRGAGVRGVECAGRVGCEMCVVREVCGGFLARNRVATILPPTCPDRTSLE